MKENLLLVTWWRQIYYWLPGKGKFTPVYLVKANLLLFTWWRQIFSWLPNFCKHSYSNCFSWEKKHFCTHKLASFLFQCRMIQACILLLSSMIDPTTSSYNTLKIEKQFRATKYQYSTYLHIHRHTYHHFPSPLPPKLTIRSIDIIVYEVGVA